MELLPFWMQVSFAVLLWIGAFVGAAMGSVWLWKWQRNYRDEKKSAVYT